MERQELGFWIGNALKACVGDGVKGWERVLELNVVAQLDLLTRCLAERFAGFLLSRDVKAFLLAVTRNVGPVVLALFPVEGLVSTFVKFYSRFHCSSSGLVVESLSVTASTDSGVLLGVKTTAVVSALPRAPAPVSSVPDLGWMPLVQFGSAARGLSGFGCPLPVLNLLQQCSFVSDFASLFWRK
ncbi:hypothetical protein KI387_019614 [Taxus chinensis]|uniref:Uncharacterized protein n=1 Tax=Taxus chinensis TaxID=29808 RepID=A0AA38GAF3_TAXCH|nr:hypothetical protein KI387_019614 [Taxus chinensis]